jgi:hypothetical protein
MQIPEVIHRHNPKQERIAKILGFAGWGIFWLQLALGGAAILLVILTISGRSFTREIRPPAGIAPTSRAPVNYSAETIPGIGISIFWAVGGILALLFTLYLAFRLTRYAKRLRNLNPELHPKKSQVMKTLRIAVITGLVGMLLFILGGGASLGVLLSKSIIEPPRVGLYDPTRIIRPIDVFIAMANMTGITAHFAETVTCLGLFNWLHPEL